MPIARSRAPAVAGAFYPADAEELKRLIHECFVSNPLGPGGTRGAESKLLGGMVPHAGYTYSGPCAAHFYALVEEDTQCVLVFGVNHCAIGSQAALSAAESWDTPLGKATVERALQDQLKAKVDFLRVDDRAHLQEHSIEVQVPFLQTVLPRFMFMPLSLGHLCESECAQLGRAVAETYEAQVVAGRKTILLASSDLSHYLSPEETERLDTIALERVLALDPIGLLNTVEEKDISMCGVIPTVVVLFAARALGATKARLLKHCHSGDAVPAREVVGYASVAIEF
jgi:MEMO1 family protein